MNHTHDHDCGHVINARHNCTCKAMIDPTPTPRTDAKAVMIAMPNNHFPMMVKADFARQLERELAEANHIIEIEVKPKELCVSCNQHWHPSFVESSWCIFCIQKKTREERDQLKQELADVRERLQVSIDLRKSSNNALVDVSKERDQLAARVKELEVMQKSFPSQKTIDSMQSRIDALDDDNFKIQQENIKLMAIVNHLEENRQQMVAAFQERDTLTAENKRLREAAKTNEHRKRTRL